MRKDISMADRHVFMINSISSTDDAQGGCAYIHNGRIEKIVDFGIPGILMVDI